MAEDHVAAPSDQPSGQVAVPGALSSSEVSRPWDPLPLSVVADLMARTERPWLIAGGHAIDLFVGRTTREHADIDVLLRRDQQAVHEVLPGWETFAADPPGQLRPWPAGEILPDGVHDIWCRPDPGSPWQLQFMLDEAEGDLWVSRRNAQVRRPLGELRHTSASGFPYLAPEVQLFYKARGRRPKDEQDLDSALPLLSGEQRDWLRAAIARTAPDHPWLGRLP
ncbi:nucleotidyltransferase domain-containing protein [Ornithinimicrobium murale]|uniref:nucleotidyltransferase domain-containing protein n=1 Tax=Ornithinimicrobium murale TaxID=1050153 RepID=UPI00192D8689|nr:hypothetical protein [Ornithinimicrobium murale]